MVGVVVGVVVVVVVCELVGVVVSDVVTLVVADVVADVVSVVESHRMYPSAHSCVPLRNGKHEPVSGSWHSPKVPVAQLVQYCATKSSLQRRNPFGLRKPRDHNDSDDDGQSSADDAALHRSCWRDVDRGWKLVMH